PTYRGREHLPRPGQRLVPVGRRRRCPWRADLRRAEQRARHLSHWHSRARDAGAHSYGPASAGAVAHGSGQRLRWKPLCGGVIPPPPPPEQRITFLQNHVARLEHNGVLNRGQSGALAIKLQGALEKLAIGEPEAAMNKVAAFINQVDAFRNAGILSDQQSG